MLHARECVCVCVHVFRCVNLTSRELCKRHVCTCILYACDFSFLFFFLFPLQKLRAFVCLRACKSVHARACVFVSVCVHTHTVPGISNSGNRSVLL